MNNYVSKPLKNGLTDTNYVITAVFSHLAKKLRVLTLILQNS
jgi:hypothetical protein